MGKAKINMPSAKTDEAGFIISKVADQFFEFIAKERRLSVYTSRNYQHAIIAFLKWLSKSNININIQDVGRMEARTYLVEAQHSLAKTTLRNHFSALKGLFRYAQQRGICDSNPFANLTLPKLEKTLPKFLWEKFLQVSKWEPQSPELVITHQVGKAHQLEIEKALGYDSTKSFLDFLHPSNVF